MSSRIFIQGILLNNIKIRRNQKMEEGVGRDLEKKLVCDIPIIFDNF
jgi:hypothetical protein